MAHRSSANNRTVDTSQIRVAEYVRASDVGTYLYCQRSWWLERIEGRTPQAQARRARGVRAHQRHGCWVWLSTLMRTIAIIATLGFILAAVAAWLGWW
jgi:tRNA(His) 5'-end guanylyltransferase